MSATEKFALERDAFERQALGLPPREFKTEEERTAFARELLEFQEAVRREKRKNGR